MTIAAPWQCTQERGVQIMPDAVFGAWREVARQLTGRAFAGELRLPGGMHCWILRGRSPSDAALVAWTDNADLGAGDLLQTQLAAGPVQVSDAFGNMRTISPIEGVHAVKLSDLPVFIENVNLELVQFRSDLRIEPDFVSAVSKIHEHQLVMRNPWPVTISGTIRVQADDQWKVSPTMQEFVIQPQAEIRLPLSIIPHRSIVAGRRHIQADIALNADRTYTLKVQADLEVGLKNIDVAASWSLAGNPLTGEDDLIITEAVTNKGSQRVNLDVCLLASGIGQNRRTIAGLGPGETAVRTFRIPDGAALLAGQHVRIGVSERDGVTRLNHLLWIPPHVQSAAQSSLVTEKQSQ